MYSNFVFLHRFLFELSCKNTHKNTDVHTHRDSDEYSRVVFSKNIKFYNQAQGAKCDLDLQGQGYSAYALKSPYLTIP